MEYLPALMLVDSVHWPCANTCPSPPTRFWARLGVDFDSRSKTLDRVSLFAPEFNRRFAGPALAGRNRRSDFLPRVPLVPADWGRLTWYVGGATGRCLRLGFGEDTATVVAEG